MIKVFVENEDKQYEDVHHMEEDDLRNSFIKKIGSLIEQRNRLQGMKFEEVVLKKFEADLKSSTERDTAAQFLHKCFADMVDDNFFIAWLAKKLHMKSIQIRNIFMKKARNLNLVIH